MSQTLVKILDATLFPAALMISGKFIGLYLTIQIFSLDWGIENLSNELFSSRPVMYQDDLIVASTYSDLFLLFIMLCGFSFYVIRAVFLHSSHIDPRLITRLAVNGLLGLVKDSFEIYHRASIWLVFLWLSDITILINVLLGKTASWVLLTGFILSLLLTVVLFRDVAFEINLAKTRLNKH
ncbi:MAG: hypothetical protein US52_C0037G0003 [candidate division WS6 bacterium GW2011_GWA2_37_6]|uniref:Uncharacterized protein n=1 Tax=candidate division WS6 bacterium GW2011_GWA2_37_6 TaxID=1619087 RepID=A0A0G0GYD6_9BACT|nr:MAG: hypothetical protein US52_C0037G0003 [candidate division WS6 bacterium GW2011_GWA2_37_6]